MSLVSIVPAEEEAAAAVVNPVLYDSGWVTYTGNGAATTVQTFSGYDVDATVHIYARYYRTTTAQYWLYWDEYANSGGTVAEHSTKWNELEEKGLNFDSGTLLRGITYQLIGATATAPPDNKAMSNRNSRGFVLQKGKTSTFRHTGSVSSSTGIQYRCVVIRNSDGQDMVNWANAK